jgi:hypothetical protein
LQIKLSNLPNFSFAKATAALICSSSAIVGTVEEVDSGEFERAFQLYVLHAALFTKYCCFDLLLIRHITFKRQKVLA